MEFNMEFYFTYIVPKKRISHKSFAVYTLSFEIWTATSTAECISRISHCFTRMIIIENGPSRDDLPMKS